MHRAKTELVATLLTVIIVVPRRSAVTTPDDDTLAIFGELEDQVTDLFVVLLGANVGESVLVCPIGSVRLVRFKRMLRGKTGGAAVTVIVDEAVNPPSVVVTVTIAFPAATAVTNPDVLTVTMPA